MFLVLVTVSLYGEVAAKLNHHKNGAVNVNDPGEMLSKLIEAGLGYVWFVALAIWGGTVNYLSRLKQGKVETFSFAELIGEWAISGFAGLLTAYICIEMDLSWHMTAFFTGISGHMGGRAIFMFEAWAKHKFPQFNKHPHSHRRKDDDNV